MCLVQSIKHRMLCGKAAQTSCLRYTGEPRSALSLLRCSSTLWCKQQARGISPSVTAFSSFIRRATVAPSPLAARASAYALHLRTAAACLSRCIRHRRRSKAKPLRGRRGRSRAAHRIDTVSTGEPRSALRLPRQARRKALAGDFFCFSYGQKRKNFVIYNCTKYQSEEIHEPRKQKERI